MRKVSALVFNYSLNGLLADRDTEFWKFCFGLLDEQGGPDDDDETLEFLGSAYAHVMGRVAYEGIAPAQLNSDGPWARILNAGRKVVFSRTLQTAEWANTTIASGDTTQEIDKLTEGGDGHIIVWGGVSLWRSLMRLDLIDDFYISMYPFVADTGTLMFADVPESYSLELVSSTAKRNGIIELHYRRRR